FHVTGVQTCALPIFELRDAAEQHGVVFGGDLDVVAGRTWPFAQRGEVEPGMTLAGGTDGDLATVDFHHAGRIDARILRQSGGEFAPALRQPRVGLRI